MNAALVVLASIFALLLGTAVSIRDFAQGYARVFALLSFSAVAWVVSNYFAGNYFGNDTLLLAANALAYFSGYLAIVAGLIFTYLYPARRTVSQFEFYPLLILVLTTLVLAPTDWVAGHPTVSDGTVTYSVGVLTGFFTFSFLVILGLIARNLVRLPESVSQQKRLQAQQILMAFLISALFGLAINVILPMIGFGWEWTGLSPFIIVWLVGTIAYSIIRHGLFDIRVTAAKVIAFLITLALFFSMYYWVGYLSSIAGLSNVFGEIGKDLLQLSLFSLLALFGRSVLSFFEERVGKILFRHGYDGAEFSNTINKLVSSAVSLQQLLDTTTYEIAGELNARFAVMVVRLDDGIASANYGKSIPIDAFLMDIVAKMPEETAPTLVEYITNESIRSSLTKLGIILYIPFIYNGTLIGFLGLGERVNGAYNERDVQVLKTISTEIAVALQNSLYVQKIQTFNDALQAKVDEATAELQTTNKRLKQLDQTKDEFISLTSHQLRTPLTTIKGYISMLLDGDAGELSPLQRKLLEEAFNSSQRMVHLISDFLNISRIQTGKFEIELSDVNLADILDEEIEQLRISATSRQLTLNYDKPQNFPILKVDEGKIRQVMMNFIDNAIYYSLSGTTINIVLSAPTDAVEFKVIDQGIGVPKDEQHKLFTKFSRASNAKKQRPDGTGIGLFMAKKVIVALEGSIIFESKEGKGSTFGFRLKR